MVVKEGKRGQLTIFIILAILIIAIALLIYFLYPKLKPGGVVEGEDPYGYIKTCMEDQIEETIEKVSLQGGSVDPTFYYLYETNKVEYLCYTNQYYKPCVVQQALLLSHVESEIQKELEENVVSCFDSLEESYKKKGYEVTLKESNPSAEPVTVKLEPERVTTSFNYKLSLTKSESNNYEDFEVETMDNLYLFVNVADSIIAWETLYGDAETTNYMDIYHNLKVEKKKQSDETTIYILTDRDTERKFLFASRSYAFPPGINLQE